jgi:luciferase-type oxidoreductase
MLDASLLGSLPADLRHHRGFARTFAPGKLTFGFIAPLEAYPNTPGPTLADHEKMAQYVDEAGFSSIWLRDVPFYDPSFGDVGQAIDPMVYAGFLAAITRQIGIGTAGIVLPLRDPLIVAKQAASVDVLLKGRFMLGLASGDRPAEYPAFGSDFDTRAERYREAFESFAVPWAATGRPTRRGSTARCAATSTWCPSPSPGASRNSPSAWPASPSNGSPSRPTAGFPT